VEAAATKSRDVQTQVIAAVPPSEDRWLESNWASDTVSLAEPAEDQKIKAPLPIAMSAERSSPTGRGRQRMVVVGSPGWMLSFVADVVIDVPGGRTAHVNPGNYELMLASVSWLAGRDDLIAASPLSQDVVRLHDITPRARATWFWITVVALPALCMVWGVVMAFWRRR
jgi:hypothetical protein